MRVQRRVLLRGLGGAAVAAPFLGSLFGRGVKAESPAAPRRLIVMFTHYGCITNRFLPTKSHGPLSAADLTPTSLKHLAPYADKLLLPRGMRAMNEWTCTMSRGQGNDYHTQVCGTYFTCQPVTPNSDDPFDFSQQKKFDAKPVGASLDHVIAQQLSRDGTPLVMRAGNRNDSPQSAISYSAPTTLYSGVGLPSQIFADLTGLFSDGPVNADTYRVTRGQSILDVVADDLATLQRADMSRTDRSKLEAWKDLLHETTGVVRAECRQAAAAELELNDTSIEAVGNGSLGTDMLGAMVTNTLDGADIYSNLAVLAALCNANPIIVLKYPGSYVYKSLGLTTEVDSLNHRVGNAGGSGPCAPGVIDALLAVDDYHARKFAHLVGQLAAIQDGDGSLLDGTAAVWFQEAADGCAHSLNNIPVVQAGSCGGYFKTGWAVNVEDGSPTLTPGNSEAICAPGTPDELENFCDQLTATDPKLANAPINKYYCNLMNALGVKAGPDGFPAAGGDAEVTHYGMYDRTEDFIGGGTNPPTIHSPGEYVELRANT